LITDTLMQPKKTADMQRAVHITSVRPTSPRLEVVILCFRRNIAYIEVVKVYACVKWLLRESPR